MHRALRLYEELDPQDGIESMLARQMIGIQNAQHGCLYKAMHPEQSLKARVAYLDKAARLSEVFLKQVQALDKHRGHASYRVTVEHVTIGSGGQAIVGNVSQQGAKGSDAPKGNSNALKHGLYSGQHLNWRRDVNALLRNASKTLRDL